MQNINKGRRGERRAAALLERKGFIILERNYRFKRCEIDLIARKEDLLIFVEVKTRASTAFGYPEEAVSLRQVEKILEGARQYLLDTAWAGRVRYDIVAVQEGPAGMSVTHFEDAFY